LVLGRRPALYMADASRHQDWGVCFGCFCGGWDPVALDSRDWLSRALQLRSLRRRNLRLGIWYAGVEAERDARKAASEELRYGYFGIHRRSRLAAKSGTIRAQCSPIPVSA
jgi:hypothetical protein